ncbi:MAG: 16S rRNA (guanine(966)-N(2))-methyltransferase RsmD [Lachnospiraceae bacterium]|nr:16S rRNA (guanine(966)-N(2))-methyltransferase RsmD [Lachnospiraceae bacterium]
MRVIAGTAKSLRLKTIEGMETRPTTDRIKETLFNMINPYIRGTRFLDLFAGSGGIGIEALSRGASEAVFIDSNKKCVECIKHNLKFTKLEDRASVYCNTATSAIHMMEDEDPFDYIFMDPPYDNLYEKDIIMMLDHSELVDEDTVIVVEASLDTDFDYVEEDTDFEVYKEKKYKSNKHVFIRKK